MRVKRPPSPRPVGQDHPGGIRQAVMVVGVLVLAGAIPYAVPGLSRWQVVRADALPFTGIFEFRSLQQPGLGGAPASTASPDPTDEELLATALHSGRDDQPTTHRSPEAEPQEGDAPPGQRLIRLSPEDTEELTVGIEDPNGDMNHFYRALLGVAAREAGAMARISVYGTSTNGADRATRSLRHAMAERFGDGGKGWVPIAPGWRYQNHQDVEWEHHGWRTRVVNRGEEAHGRYGFSGVLALNRGGASTASFMTTEEGPANRAVSRFRLFYHAWPEGGAATLQVDEGSVERLDARSATPEDRVHDVVAPHGAHQLRLGVAEGDLQLYGVVMENDGPGVVVDGLSLIGAFTRVLLHFNEEHLRRQVAARAPDLQLFWLGANDAVSRSVPFRREQFVANYTRVLRRAQAGRPEASCLVMSIMDKGERVDGRFIRTIRRVPTVVEAQREAALNAGCAFFNIYEAMGGAGTMRRWWRTDPRLVSGDLGHLTGYGSRVVGRLMYLALVQGASEFDANQ